MDDTAFDTTERETRWNSRQPLARKLG